MRTRPPCTWSAILSRALLCAWCASPSLSAWIIGAPPTIIPTAIVGGFFLRDPYRPLGEVRIEGEVVEHEPVSEPWADKRGCLHIDGSVSISPRGQLPADPSGDLLRVGPLLVSGGRSLIDGEDREGLFRRRGTVRLRHHRRPVSAVRVGGQRDRAAGGLLRRAPIGRRRWARAGRVGEAAGVLRRRGGDQPRRRRLGDAGAPKASAQSPYSDQDQPAPGVATRRHRSAFRAPLSSAGDLHHAGALVEVHCHEIGPQATLSFATGETVAKHRAADSRIAPQGRGEGDPHRHSMTGPERPTTKRGRRSPRAPKSQRRPWLWNGVALLEMFAPPLP